MTDGCSLQNEDLLPEQLVLKSELPSVFEAAEGSIEKIDDGVDHPSK